MGGNYLSLKEEGRARAAGAGVLSDNDDDLLLQQQKRATPNLENRICKFLEVLDSWDVKMPIFVCCLLFVTCFVHTKVATEYTI